MDRIGDNMLAEVISMLNAVASEDATKERMALALGAAIEMCERLSEERQELKRERDMVLDALRSAIECRAASSRGVVYFVTADDPRMVKIGFTSNIERRVKSLQTANHGKVRVIGCVPGTKSDETSFHRRFHKYRRSGEWFSVAGDLEKFLKTLS